MDKLLHITLKNAQKQLDLSDAEIDEVMGKMNAKLYHHINKNDTKKRKERPLQYDDQNSPILTFGKYENKSMGEVIEKDPAWINWLSRWDNNTFQVFIDIAKEHYKPEYEVIRFGKKHKGETLKTIFKEDPQYLEWLVTKDFVDAHLIVAANMVMGKPVYDMINDCTEDEILRKKRDKNHEIFNTQNYKD